ncbi:hypothetical protein D3C72_2186020 [compost metagenome]
MRHGDRGAHAGIAAGIVGKAQAGQVMHAVDGGERQRGPAILPGAAGLRGAVEHEEIAPWLEPELFQMIG